MTMGMKNGNLAKNSDDQGTNFDLRAEVFINGGSVTSGETFCITGITRNANQAKEAVLTFGAFTPLSLNSGDVISIKVSTRVGTNGSGSHCGGHSNAVGLRLYFDSASRASKFGILTATASNSSPLASDPFQASISLVSGPKPNGMRLAPDAPVFSEARVVGSPLVIDYTYDALHRLKNAHYNDGRDFSYEYDPNGNTLSYSDPTTTTTYTYDVANELLTAQNGEVVWNYEYDQNGSLIKVLPNGNESDGAKQYSYNAAGYLIKVETLANSAWNTQAEMTYNGLGVRMTSNALGVTTQYASDGQLPLTITSTDHTATVLYGIGPVAEKTTEWNYVLSDGIGTPRQLTDTNGEVTLFVRYNPWGKPLETSGTGNFDASFIGTLIDATTGLIYVGNGQYYDPETGRFLTRNFSPNSTNPYVPWNPIGIMLGPLAVVSMYYSQKKNKKPNIYLLLLVLLFLALACKGCPEISWTSTPQPTETPAATATSAPEPAASATATSTPEAPTQEADVALCPTPVSPDLKLYGILLDGASWSQTEQDTILAAVRRIGEEFVRLGVVDGPGWEAFKTVYGDGVLFYKDTTGNKNYCEGGVQKVTCFNNAPGTIAEPHRLLVHELAHTLVQTRYYGAKVPYAQVQDAALVDEKPREYGGPQWITGTHPSGGECTTIDPNSDIGRQCLATESGEYGSFERTSLGYTGKSIPAQYHGDTNDWSDYRTNPSEDFADMFLNWVYNSFDDSTQAYNAGRIRYKFMEDHMPGWITGGVIKIRGSVP